ncbi:transposase [Dissulfurispira thermophila]|uniref:transposase n=1 Tax=Dissulfurispira thermophila TaxID=2715679 RepID=UPI003BEED51E
MEGKVFMAIISIGGSESKEDWLEILNDTDHQFCFIHMQRNIKRNMSKEDVKVFYEELLIIKRMNAFEKAVARFEKLCKRFEKKYPAYILQVCLLSAPYKN